MLISIMKHFHISILRWVREQQKGKARIILTEVLTGTQCLIFLLTSIFIFFPSRSHSQCEPIDALYCESAPLMQLENFCGRTTSMFTSCCPEFCGFTTIIHNPTYMKFVAIDTFIRLDILVLPCISGHGIQGAILSSCPWENADVLVCNGNTQEGEAMILESGDVISGETYWLLIDGASGAVCNFLIFDVTGLAVSNSPVISLQQIGDTLYALPQGFPVESYDYAWFDCDENIVLNTTPAFAPPVSGCYCVTVRDSISSGTFCTTLILSSAANIEHGKISIYPNPSKEMLDIEVAGYTKPLSLKVFDLQGHNIDQVIINEGYHLYFWNSKMLPGVYVFMISDGDKILALENVVYSGK